ncbi:hypothetical protein V8C86DRAFT_3146505 [Haematococcus lacustris]
MASNKYIVAVGEARPASADGKIPSASAIYRHAGSKDGLPSIEPLTLYELFVQAVEKFPSNPCLGQRPKNADGTVGDFVFKTYKEVGEEVELLASGLRHVGVNPKSRVGVLGANCPEWMIAMQACNRQSLHCVPLYDSLGENAIDYIINHSECVVAFVASDKFPGLIKALDKTRGVLKTVVYWGPGSPSAQKAVTDAGYALYSFQELQELGRQHPSFPVPPSPEDLCTIMYTSGTTGDPKGVMLKHSAVVAGVANGIIYCRRNGVDFKPPDRFLSYLPLAHIFDRINEEMFLYLGCTIGYWQGDIAKLVDDISALQPAMFVGVPRVFDRIYARITDQIKNAGLVKRLIFNWGFSRKLYFMNQGSKQKEAAPFFDRILFSKIASRLGGKVKAVVSGGAPLAPHVEEFLRITMCAFMVQGYGLTETCATSMIAAADTQKHAGSVGCPTPGTELRLESVPEMNYDALDPNEPKGEVLLRGPSLFSGYYKQQGLTDEVLERDGWFHTGDIGVLSKDGALKIIDRKKNIFKLSQGEYVAVEKLEGTYKKCPFVDQVWVYGNSYKSCLVAVVVPAAGPVAAWASSQGLPEGLEGLVANDKLRAHILAELVAVGKADKLKGYELVKAVHLDAKPWSVDDELLTPTFKLKRPQLQKKYQAVLDAMYSGLKE